MTLRLLMSRGSLGSPSALILDQRVSSPAVHDVNVLDGDTNVNFFLLSLSNP